MYWQNYSLQRCSKQQGFWLAVEKELNKSRYSHSFNTSHLVRGKTPQRCCSVYWDGNYMMCADYHLCEEGDYVFACICGDRKHTDTQRKRSVCEGRSKGNRDQRLLSRTLKNTEKHFPKWKWLIKELLQCELKTWPNGRQETRKEERREEDQQPHLLSELFLSERLGTMFNTGNY